MRGSFPHAPTRARGRLRGARRGPHPAGALDRRGGVDCPARSSGSSDTYKALNGSRIYVRNRVARAGSNQGGTKLALNLDIDNTSLATYYDTGKPVAATLRLVKYAKSKGVYILFNTGRNVSLAGQDDRRTQARRLPGRRPLRPLQGRGAAAQQAALPAVVREQRVHDHRQHRQPQHRLRRRQLRARLPAAQLRQPPRLRRLLRRTASHRNHQLGDQSRPLREA